ncbi:helix-turn-helix domain-containing protein [Candidatus Omnitrophota bacterium]
MIKKKVGSSRDLEVLGKLTIGQLLRSNRQRKGLKVYELAKLVKVNPVYITQIEKGYKLPSPETFLKIIKHLDIDIYTWLELEDKFMEKKFPNYKKTEGLFRDFLVKNHPSFARKIKRAKKIEEKRLNKKGLNG